MICNQVPPFVIRRYQVLTARYQERGWDVPCLPAEGYAAQNVVWEMVARLNDREPLEVRLATEPCIVAADPDGD